MWTLFALAALMLRAYFRRRSFFRTEHALSETKTRRSRVQGIAGFALAFFLATKTAQSRRPNPRKTAPFRYRIFNLDIAAALSVFGVGEVGWVMPVVIWQAGEDAPDIPAQDGHAGLGANGFTGEPAGSPLEADLAIRHPFDNGLTLTVGAGTGIIAGIGTPLVRVFSGLTWARPYKKEIAQPVDTDGDGIPDNDDRCPTEPGDRDDFEDKDGCPELDNDGDGIRDSDDACGSDPEDMDAFEDTDGCPDPDNDNDGIPDANDDCVGEPEDKDGFEDTNGCPDPDNDRDGIVDANDDCPLEPEVLNNIADTDGCPDETPTLVTVSKTQIEILDPINFKTNSDVMQGDRSFEILNQVAGVLTAMPSLRVRIEGHTDNKGSKRRNIKLSGLRASAVKNYLVGKGIQVERMESKGFGPDQPIADNKTAAGRAANRRVDFIILEE